jgi:hypothetical protein
MTKDKFTAYDIEAGKQIIDEQRAEIEKLKENDVHLNKLNHEIFNERDVWLEKSVKQAETIKTLVKLLTMIEVSLQGKPEKLYRSIAEKIKEALASVKKEDLCT